MKDQCIKVAVVGNPNCGKTTLFNALTGSNLKVANWPGVTVEKIEGFVSYDEFSINLIDTPGIYSLASYTIEEKVTRNCIMDQEIAVILNVVDASSLERNLYLTMQLLELKKPMVIALNMMDIVKERGWEIDLHRLPEMLGNIPIVPVSAAKKKGINILLHAIVHHYEEGPISEVFHYSEEIEDKIEKLEVMMGARYPKHEFKRWHAVKLLEGDESVLKDHPIEVETIANKSHEKQIIQEKYHYIESIIDEVLFYKDKKAHVTEKIDQYLTHPVLGLFFFFMIMMVVFFFTFTIGDFLKGLLEDILITVSGMSVQFLQALHVADWLQSMLIDGALAGVGGILTFIPNIAILFLALALLEDSGYMSRVAYVMDGVMGKVGLSGKAFLPMILGFGCTVPAIMATRALESEEDRKRTMIITPFMSCSARLPIYVLFSGMFFEKNAYLVSFSLYLLGLLIAIFTASILSKLKKESKKEVLLIELPEYKRPNLRTIRIYVTTKLKDYLTRAGTVIFIASLIIWLLLNFGPSGMTADPSNSFGAILGKLLVPVTRPAGLDSWQFVVALISGISAKEVVVSSLNVLFSSTAANGNQSLLTGIRLVSPTFSALNAYAFMTFCLLYTPCAATIATIKKESNSWKFTIKVILFQLWVAWLVSTVIYQIGSIMIAL